MNLSFNIVSYQNSINELPMFNGLPFFAHNKEIKMFIGSLNGKDNIKKQFTVSLSYSDVYGNRFKEKQLIDPSRYMGLGNINKKGLHEIAKYLEKLSKSSGKSERQLESLVKVFKNGINLRNNNLEKLDIDDLFLLIKNLYKYSDKESLEFYPGLYDTHILLIVTKNKLLLKSRLSKKKKEVIAIINEILNYQYFLGYGNEMQKKWEKLVNLL